MLISFQIENFRSFGPEQELSAVANTKQKNLEEHLVEVPGHDEKLVPVIAIYGANGAGKSNLVLALVQLTHWLLPNAEFLGRNRNAFSPPEARTRFALRFLADNVVYEYGIVAGDQQFDEEWLSVVTKTGAERVVFERRSEPDGAVRVEFGKDLSGLNEKLDAVRVLGAKRDQLFLSRLFRDIDTANTPGQLLSVYRWLQQLIIVQADAPYLGLERELQGSPEFRKYVSGLLSRQGTGVEELGSRLVEEKSARELSAIDFAKFETAAIGSAFARQSHSALVKLKDDVFGIYEVFGKHVNDAGAAKWFAFGMESDGTKRLANLAPALFEASRNPCVFVIDELDRSLHALLVKEFVQEFLARAKGHRNQLIFTTHETHALDQELLRRDEVWFVEKNKDGASQLFSLDDFPVRTDLRLDRGYLMGRFGAVPHIQSP